MDEIVKLAMSKWPNVPHCYGWLALDARGAWRMRDERAQRQGLPGDKITNPALLNFIVRNYTQDDRHCWYFQNGPQRVYVTLEATPYIARTDPAQGFVLHTGEALSMLDEAWISEAGRLIVVSDEKVAQIDDRDMAEYLDMLRLDGEPLDDDAFLAWLNKENKENMEGKLTLITASQNVSVQRLKAGDLGLHFGFNPVPKANS